MWHSKLRFISIRVLLPLKSVDVPSKLIIESIVILPLLQVAKRLHEEFREKKSEVCLVGVAGDSIDNKVSSSYD